LDGLSADQFVIFALYGMIQPTNAPPKSQAASYQFPERHAELVLASCQPSFKSLCSFTVIATNGNVAIQNIKAPINILSIAITANHMLCTFSSFLPANKKEEKVPKRRKNPAHQILTVSPQTLALYPQRITHLRFAPAQTDAHRPSGRANCQ
jgi:hypothetical protein